MNNINNQNIQETIFVDGNPFTNPTISMLQKVYQLDKYEFDKIIHGRSKLNETTNSLIGICIAFLINMIAKFLFSKIDTSFIFDNWEIYAFLYH